MAQEAAGAEEDAMTVAEFEAKTGRPPADDDLDRVNCPEVGTHGHMQCGWCPAHDQPRPTCGCLAPRRKKQ